jgi:hypothetical protein
MIEAESLSVLNTLTEHGFLDAFKNVVSAWKGAYSRKMTNSRVMVVVGPKLIFEQMASPVPEIMDTSL